MPTKDTGSFLMVRIGGQTPTGWLHTQQPKLPWAQGQASYLLLLVLTCCVCRNGNGTVEADEFRAGLGDLGSNGEAMKDYVFHRVDHVIGSSGKLSVGGFGNALVLVRNVMLGY
jgi:hypothetical protein